MNGSFSQDERNSARQRSDSRLHAQKLKWVYVEQRLIARTGCQAQDWYPIVRDRKQRWMVVKGSKPTGISNQPQILVNYEWPFHSISASCLGLGWKFGTSTQEVTVPPWSVDAGQSWRMNERHSHSFNLPARCRVPLLQLWHPELSPVTIADPNPSPSFWSVPNRSTLGLSGAGLVLNLESFGAKPEASQTRQIQNDYLWGWTRI